MLCLSLSISFTSLSPGAIWKGNSRRLMKVFSAVLFAALRIRNRAIVSNHNQMLQSSRSCNGCCFYTAFQKRKKKSITLKELSMGSICWPFFIRKLLYRDPIALFVCTLKVEKPNSCVCTCMFGFCEDFRELSSWHPQCLSNWKPCLVLGFIKTWNDTKEKLIHLKTCSTKWSRGEVERFECFWSCRFFLHLKLDCRRQKALCVMCVWKHPSIFHLWKHQSHGQVHI